MKNKIYTVTVALSAYNEAKNIKAFLKSVLKQKEKGFIIKSIQIYNDGSSDNTAAQVKKIKSSKIKVFNYKKRIGKSSRLNQIYQSLNTDFLLQSDADVIFSHDLVIYDMIQPLINNKKIGMCGGNPTPLKAKTFLEKSVNYTCEAYIFLRKTLKGGNNIFSVDGRILAYRKELVKKINVPASMIANDAYTYFCCITKHYKYKFVPEGIVYFRSPQVIKDQIRQNTRFVAAHIRMEKYFPKSLVRNAYHIPKLLLARLFLKQFIKHPIECIFIFFINIYCKLNAIKKEKKLTAIWPMAFTTKGL